MKLHSCLLAFVLGCKVTAAITHEVFEEKRQGILRCPRPAERTVTWSRESNGNKADIFTIDGDREIRHNDPGRRYSSLADKSLHIRSAALSDSGTYFCNNEAAAELTVVPSGTPRLTAVVGTNLDRECPFDVNESHVPTWTRENAGMRIPVLAPNKMLTIRDVQPDDAGLYYCDGKPAVYLNVSKDERPEKAAGSVLGVLLLLLLLLLLVVGIVLFLTWRRRIQRRGGGEQLVEVVYAEITDGLSPAGSNQHDVTYSIIHGLPAQGHKSVASRPNETLYSLINSPCLHAEESPQDQLKTVSSSPPASWTSIP